MCRPSNEFAVFIFLFVYVSPRTRTGTKKRKKRARLAPSTGLRTTTGLRATDWDLRMALTMTKDSSESHITSHYVYVTSSVSPKNSHYFMFHFLQFLIIFWITHHLVKKNCNHSLFPPSFLATTMTKIKRFPSSAVCQSHPAFTQRNNINTWF